ncbi:DsbA family protein [Candidatus Uhrbacteria bacterium]|nr:DsbA family protein [Candidatus Uhrbacteria bacterium]
MSSETSFWNSNPKTMFYMGLILGIAVSAVLALGFVLNAMGGGKGLSFLNQGSPLAQAPSQPNDLGPSAPTPSAPVKDVDAKIDHVLGNKNAKVTFIEYSDFQCPFCQRHLPSIKQMLKDFPNDVRLVYRHFPLSSIHPFAQKAAEASECAAKLAGNDAFWKMHDKMFESSADLTVDALVAMAKGIGLNEGAFKSCVDSGEMAARVNADAASGDQAGVQGTPANFINGKLISGAVPYPNLKSALEAAGAKK